MLARIANGNELIGEIHRHRSQLNLSWQYRLTVWNRLTNRYIHTAMQFRTIDFSQRSNSGRCRDRLESLYWDLAAFIFRTTDSVVADTMYLCRFEGVPDVRLKKEYLEFGQNSDFSDVTKL